MVEENVEAMTDVETPEVEAPIEAAPEEPFGFMDHILKAERLCDELNTILRIRDFRICEAFVTCTFKGEVVLVRNVTTNGMGPNGPITLSANVPVPLPWTMTVPVADRPTPERIINDILAHIEKEFTKMCGAQKLLRLRFDQYAKGVSTTIATAKAGPGNGRIITP